MGFWSSFSSTFSSSTEKETDLESLKAEHGFKDFEHYKQELQNFSLEIDDEEIDTIDNKPTQTNKDR